MTISLYSALGSNSSERVEWVLSHKALEWERVEVSNEALKTTYRDQINPFGFVPALVHEGHTLVESMAIIEYLEECFPEKPVLGSSASERAEIRAICSHVGSTIHSPQNRTVLKFLRPDLTEADKKQLRAGWIGGQLLTMTPLLWGNSAFCCGLSFSAADVFVATIYRKYLQHGGAPIDRFESHRTHLAHEGLIPDFLL
ncbi:glutathione S-transferase family protein [Pseudovibrio sp. SPO723]|uniref:glutathione S-transferase family protein n=1 Tax=Nesiotobacter zosterae TaxID=392721 RepID=UPI0029C3E47C|nr:glutathione S-transferase N-terminal domain-containing protein [Pseudovibrio sp. SPO723]MDX5595105.1 glutathione S-transferase N-terminal domain-containing protein [Pseudovibrio sp. SPO723]